MEILYRDDQLIAVNKPAGLLVHRSPIDRHETRFALQMVRDQIGQHVYPLHRLDKPTSGILLFALDQDSARLMMPIFSSGRVEKTYLAVVRGYTPLADVIDYPLKEQLDRMTDALVDPCKAAQSAVTHYKRLAIVELPHPVGHYATTRYSLVSVSPRTGRKHQIRRHMKHIFHPVIGDTSHGDGRHNQFFRERLNCHRLLLTATGMTLKSPITGHSITITAGLEPSFTEIIDRLGWGGVALF